MTDVVTPNYQQKIADGHIINNPCVYTMLSTSSSGSGSIHYENVSWEYYLNGPVTRFRSGDSTLPGFRDNLAVSQPTDLRARAKQQAIANIDSTPYAFGEDSLELRETIRFLKSPFGSLLNLSRGFKSSYKKRKRLYRLQTYKPTDKLLKHLEEAYGNVNKADWRLLKAHADTWLQYRFAASPLVRSCIDVLDAYSSVPVTLPERLSSRGIQTATEQASKTETYTDQTFDQLHMMSWDVKASILYEVSNPIRDWRYRLGFRAKDWPTTFWQVMPYSFMVDRVVDVTSFSKGVINLLDPKVKILSACVREKTLDRYTHQLTSGGPYAVTTNGEVVVDDEFIYDRQPWNPSIRDTVPTQTWGYLVKDATHVLDLASLILSNFKV